MVRMRLIFEKQWLHLLCLGFLLAGLVSVDSRAGSGTGHLFGIATQVWYWLAAGIAVFHQTYVWFFWRTQLHASLPTRVLGRHAFHTYAAGFALIGIARVVVVFLLAISNQGTLSAEPTVLKAMAVVAMVPAFYLFYSVIRYFGAYRAFGIDHFDARYRSIPFVKKGIFRFTNNGMYIYGFFILWVPALWWSSHAALYIALFNHCYIWVHYFATEQPDIKRIYAVEQKTGNSGQV